MRVALVHDYLNQYGGGERVLEALSCIFPEAPIYTLFYDKARTGYAFDDKQIYTSFLQKIPGLKTHHRPFLVFMPLAIEQFDLSQYDLVISDSHSYAKGVVVAPEANHICYCHTPIRYAWDDSQRYIEEFGYPTLASKVIPVFMNYIRIWDEQAAARVDSFIANSGFVSKRIKKYYHRESEVIYPPVRTDIFYTSEGKGDYFLMVGRFLPYKKFDLAVQAFNYLGLPLKIIGTGPEKKRLQQMANSNIEFVGLVSDKVLRDYYANCKALIFPQEEDFGIAAVEAMAAGKPVIAYGRGGAKEIVEPAVTGLFFKDQTFKSLVKTLKIFDPHKFDSQLIKAKAEEFSQERFKQKIKTYIENYIG
jgi:glycosyltransferase involved in cell wall biosynthesis